MSTSASRGASSRGRPPSSPRSVRSGSVSCPPTWRPWATRVPHAVHPVTPVVGEGRLFVFMEPTSPKGHDIARRGGYALHCQVGDANGAGGEFYVRGRGERVDSRQVRPLAVGAAQATHPATGTCSSSCASPRRGRRNGYGDGWRCRSVREVHGPTPPSFDAVDAFGSRPAADPRASSAGRRLQFRDVVVGGIQKLSRSCVTWMTRAARAAPAAPARGRRDAGVGEAEPPAGGPTGWLLSR